MANEIDILMDLDPTNLSSQDLDSIIAYHRKTRSNFEAGVKPKKGGEKMSLDNLVQSMVKVPVAEPIKRRF